VGGSKEHGSSESDDEGSAGEGEIERVIKCDGCDANHATVHCDECREFLCATCDLHSAGGHLRYRDHNICSVAAYIRRVDFPGADTADEVPVFGEAPDPHDNGRTVKCAACKHHFHEEDMHVPGDTPLIVRWLVDELATVRFK
jgi:hypothetical protein